jgi:hypothetical protein
MAKTMHQPMAHPARNSVLKPLFVSLGFIILLIYSVIAFNTGDAFWFLANTEVSQPLRIIVRHEGERIVYQPGSAEFNQLAPLVEQSISSLNNNALIDIGLSDVTLEDYNNVYTVVEVHYDQPIKFGTTFRTGSPTQLLIPITGRHSGAGLFFRGNTNEWFYGALRMADPLPLYAALADLGYEGEVFNPATAND